VLAFMLDDMKEFVPSQRSMGQVFTISHLRALTRYHNVSLLVMKTYSSQQKVMWRDATRSGETRFILYTI